MVERTTGIHDFPVDVWIDGRHLVRRAAMTLTLTLPGGQSMQESMTMDFTHYGPQPRPTPPPSDQVQDLGGLLGASG